MPIFKQEWTNFWRNKKNILLVVVAILFVGISFVVVSYQNTQEKQEQLKVSARQEVLLRSEKEIVRHSNIENKEAIADLYEKTQETLHQSLTVGETNKWHDPLKKRNEYIDLVMELDRLGLETHENLEKLEKEKAENNYLLEGHIKPGSKQFGVKGYYFATYILKKWTAYVGILLFIGFFFDLFRPKKNKEEEEEKLPSSTKQVLTKILANYMIYCLIFFVSIVVAFAMGTIFGGGTGSLMFPLASSFSELGFFVFTVRKIFVYALFAFLLYLLFAFVSLVWIAEVSKSQKTSFIVMLVFFLVPLLLLSNNKIGINPFKYMDTYQLYRRGKLNMTRILIKNTLVMLGDIGLTGLAIYLINKSKK